MSDAEKLFDIFCHDNQQRIELERYTVRMTQDDFLFYEGQKDSREAKCLPQ